MIQSGLFVALQWLAIFSNSNLEFCKVVIYMCSYPVLTFWLQPIQMWCDLYWSHSPGQSTARKRLTGSTEVCYWKRYPNVGTLCPQQSQLLHCLATKNTGHWLVCCQSGMTRALHSTIPSIFSSLHWNVVYIHGFKYDSILGFRQ